MKLAARRVAFIAIAGGVAVALAILIARGSGDAMGNEHGSVPSLPRERAASIDGSVRAVTIDAQSHPRVSGHANQSSQHRAVAPPAPATVTGGTAADTTPDLFRFAMAAADGASTAMLTQALHATVWCISARDKAAGTEAIALPQHLRTPESERAGEKIAGRCRGFVLNDPSAAVSLRQRVSEKLRAGQGYAYGISTGDITPVQIRLMLVEQDAINFALALRDLMPAIERSLAVEDSGETRALVGVGFLLATCDVGRDCSSESFNYLRGCAFEGQCQGSVMARLTEGLTPTQVEQVQRYRERIGAAYRAKDYGFFGAGLAR